MDQKRLTGPDEYVLQFKVVFVVCWHQSGNVVELVYLTVLLSLLKTHNFLS